MFDRYFSPLLKYAAAYLFMPLFYNVGKAVLTVIYSLLSDIAPSVFPIYNQVLQKEEYLELQRITGLVCAFVVIFILNYIMVLHDNSRYERAVARTDALYKVRDELSKYIKDTVASDAIAAAAPQIIFLSLSLIAFPERLARFFGSYLLMHINLIESLGFFASFFLITLAAFSARVAAAPHALLKYRGAWLTSFVDS